MNAVFKALADPTRRKVLELLRKQPMTAGELADHFPVSRPTMSAHFAVLREADLIESTKIGTTITYHLKLSVLEDALLGFARLFGTEAPNATANATQAIEPGHAQKGSTQ
ncbi:autorepressor SdpR family transcription factor [Sphingopyxis flava]|uniref:DNA-binding transcriptional regulator, ArsR family n=1 Tax=Sphingopyxis flava TaxID=1507287 RepID=A0A1T5CG96_9SPHN|nr:autorepressor SdpR family transcription factor [Sphingopyxis flava]SKB58454.1 DNA-binding transcriptional regulator, ArsR family [Sphingopyxis flava]